MFGILPGDIVGGGRPTAALGKVEKEGASMDVSFESPRAHSRLLAAGIFNYKAGIYVHYAGCGMSDFHLS